MILVSDPDLQIHVGDALEVLRGLPDGSVNCCATSPPYWGLRDYGAEGQIGLEASPEEYVAAIVAVFREVRRVLADDGTLWLNLGDSYAANGTQSSGGNGNETRADGMHGAFKVTTSALRDRSANGTQKRRPVDLKPKDLVGIPWRVAFALQADGWYLRSDIIWAKPNPMPESVTDRPTKSHEYVFLLSKGPRYFFDQEAVREPAEWERWGDQTNGKHQGQQSASGWIGSKSKRELVKRRTVREGIDVNGGGQGNGSITLREGQGRNVRSVWEIATQPYSGAHFATWPEALAERIIKAGCPEWVCGTCGKPKGAEAIRTPLGTGPSHDPTLTNGRAGMNRERRPDEGTRFITKAEQRDYAMQLRESPHRDEMAAEAGEAFAHYIRTDDSGARPIPPDLLGEWLLCGWLTLASVEDTGCGHDNWRAGTVLDPFGGSGTTGLVARRHGRRALLIELNADYARLAAERCQQLSLLADAL